MVCAYDIKDDAYIVINNLIALRTWPRTTALWLLWQKAISYMQRAQHEVTSEHCNYDTSIKHSQVRLLYFTYCLTLLVYLIEINFHRVAEEQDTAPAQRRTRTITKAKECFMFVVRRTWMLKRCRSVLTPTQNLTVYLLNRWTSLYI